MHFPLTGSRAVLGYQRFAAVKRCQQTKQRARAFELKKLSEKHDVTMTIQPQFPGEKKAPN